MWALVGSVLIAAGKVIEIILKSNKEDEVLVFDEVKIIDNDNNK